MSNNPLAEMLGRLLGDRAAVATVVVVVVHRGLPGDCREVPGDAIAHVRRQALVLDDDREIPLHRVLAVRLGAEVVWQRASSGGVDRR